MKLSTRVAILGLVAVTMCLLGGCSRHDNNERYILVTVITKMPYWQTAAAGLSKAGAQYGVKVDVRGPETYDPQAEVKEFRDAMALKPAGILVSVVDYRIDAAGHQRCHRRWNSGDYHRRRCSCQ